MRSTTPDSVNENVKKLVEKLGLKTEPVFVPVKDTDGHKKSDCFYNVRRKIEKEGGDILYGWNVWEYPEKLIEGEFHAVWVSPNGNLIDITPKVDGETEILFIPAPGMNYNGEAPDNVRVALSNSFEVQEIIRRGEEMTKLRREYNDGTGNSHIPGDVYEDVMSRGLRPKAPVGRNDKCPCGSGLKYKKCHGKN
jgi:hypothetical protein